MLPDANFFETCQRVDTMHVSSVKGSLPIIGAAGERSEFDVKPPLGTPLLIFPQGYLLNPFLQGDISARQQGFEI